MNLETSFKINNRKKERKTAPEKKSSRGVDKKINTGAPILIVFVTQNSSTINTLRDTTNLWTNLCWSRKKDLRQFSMFLFFLAEIQNTQRQKMRAIWKNAAESWIKSNTRQQINWPYLLIGQQLRRINWSSNSEWMLERIFIKLNFMTSERP